MKELLESLEDAQQVAFEHYLEYIRCQYLVIGFEKGVSIGKKAFGTPGLVTP